MMNLWYPPADYNGIGILQVSSWTKYSFDEKQDSFFVVTQPKNNVGQWKRDIWSDILIFFQLRREGVAGPAHQPVDISPCYPPCPGDSAAITRNGAAAAPDLIRRCRSDSTPPLPLPLAGSSLGAWTPRRRL